MIADRGCAERGCACYDSRIDCGGVEMVKREWVGLTEPELHEINPTWPAPNQWWGYEDVLAFVRAVEAKLKEKNT